MAAVGPVFTYYEFALEGTKRLNDDEWKQMLTWGNRSEYLPKWFGDVYALAEPWAPEYPSTIVIIGVMTLTVTVALFGKRMKFRKHAYTAKKA